MSSRLGFTALISFFVATLFSPAIGQTPTKNPLQELVQGNERFGIRLLEQVHAQAPEKNAMVAPLPLTVMLGTIQTSARRDEAIQELAKVFGWGDYPDLSIPSRMIVAAMEKPAARRSRQGPSSRVRRGLPSIWMENRLLYRSPKNAQPLLSEEFMQSASADFGMQLVNTGDRNPTAADLSASRQQVGRLPQMNALDEVWLSSGLHLRDTWERLFMMSEPKLGEFQLESGQTRTVQQVVTGIESLRHIKTDQLEAVVLPCDRVEMAIVLPKPGMKIQELEQLLVANPSALDGMEKMQGSVMFTIFEMKTSMRLEKPLQAMGIKDIFQHLDGVTRLPGHSFDERIAKAHIADVAQNIDFGADKHGIHADAETLIGAIPGGVMVNPKAFRMALDRPFVFFVRDTVTGAMLLAGVLMDPGQAH